MPVYVDHLLSCQPNRHWRWTQSCHLFADTLEELHAFAKKIGMSRSWFQYKPGGLPHYDLTAGRRLVAVQRGAIELERNDAVVKWREIKTKLQLPVCMRVGVGT